MTTDFLVALSLLLRALFSLLPKCAADKELKAGITDPDLNSKYSCWYVFEGRKMRLFYIIDLKFLLAVSPYSAARVQAFSMRLHSSEIDFFLTQDHRYTLAQT